MNWVLIGFILSIVAGIAFIVYMVILNRKEDKKTSMLLKEMDDMAGTGQQRFVLDGVYTEEEKGFK